MRALIIEDEAPAARRLRTLLSEVDASIEVIEVIDSIEASVKWLNFAKSPDLIFMDIQLADGQSFEIFNQVKLESPVIFTTAFDEYSLKAFKVNSIDYLLKPIEPAELKRSIEKYKTLKSNFSSSQDQESIMAMIRSFQQPVKEYKQRFLIKTGEKLRVTGPRMIF